MKKVVSLFVVLGMMSGAAVAGTASPSHLAKDGKGGYNVTYDYKDKAKTGWYTALHAGFSLLNFDVKQKIDGSSVGSDDFNFEPVFDGSVAVGQRFGYFWRGEIELGYMGQFSDSDAGLDFDLSVPYALVNGYYDFLNGAYLGAGVGIALPIAHLDGVWVTGGDRDKTGVSPMAGVMVGFAHKLDDNLVLDLRYRLAGYNGVRQNITATIDDGGVAKDVAAQTKIGLILDNSISIGMRYEF